MIDDLWVPRYHGDWHYTKIIVHNDVFSKEKQCSYIIYYFLKSPVLTIIATIPK